MQLIIAEKSSLGRAIVQALPLPHSAQQGYIQCGQDITVTWCSGHLLEPCSPEAYLPQYAKWNLYDLPIAPAKWKLTPRSETMNHLRIIGSLIERSHEIIHAGDPDREGQLIVDEVLHYFNVEVPVRRLLINDLTPTAIAASLNQLTSNTEYQNLSRSAQCRQQADWLYGINLTRALTLVARDKGKEGVFSVGRVQTPVLGLIAKRDAEIEHFKPTRYYSIVANFETLNTKSPLPVIDTLWQTPPSREMHCDEQGRLLNRKIAERVVRSVSVNEIIGTVIKVTDKQLSEPSPLPFSLSTLQIEAAKRFGYSPQYVLDGCLMLFDKYKLITYPKSDCRYLPDNQFNHRADLLNTLILNAPLLTNAVHGCNLTIKSHAWNDQKTGPHHAIIPTAQTLDIATLQTREQALYTLICRRYIAQFYPSLITDESIFDISIDKERFQGKQTTVRHKGWKAIDEPDQHDDGGIASAAHATAGNSLREGEQVYCRTVKIMTHETPPPEHFDDASLLSAMTSIAHYVEDPYIKKTLRASDGLGTEATRAAIIEALYRRDYIAKNGRRIVSTEKGRDLIYNLPTNCITPDMTAIWEAALDTISSGSTKPKDFITRITDEISHLIETLTGIPVKKANGSQQAIAPPPSCPKCQSEMVERTGKYGKFWACSQFPNCKASLPWKLNTTKKAKAVKMGDSPPIPCPNCHAPLIRRTGTRGEFWGCSNYPSCRKTFKDIEGKPLIHINPRP
ncbi:DNA topoisomerase 3 [Alkalimarinus alittae]|uniref:DNA topoisomerase n=1 Tax=Alkalimarinus alittae TaxID=2961619 RepID=A0ABY6N5Y4_9ALTE|nr:DNA topoisomerase 3 [Alkalimarinus alittae]UZE97535.1 DNA topoisomerase 3 [Alkalimarinus alittae]